MIRYSDGQATILVAHVLDGLASLEPESVQMGVTSPPYFGLRNYSTPPQLWGPTDCDHVWKQGVKAGISGGTKSAKVQIKGEANFQIVPAQSYRECFRCGAWEGHLGSEDDPDCLAWARHEPPCHSCFVCHLRTVFKAVWRVLRDDGTLWINIGSTYAAGKEGREDYGDTTSRLGPNNDGVPGAIRPGPAVPRNPPSGWKVKDFIPTPWLVALALQYDGWYLRSDIIWHKVNPMPESVEDRPTRSHEYLFLLAKNEHYYYDAEAIKEKVGESTRRAASFRDGGVYTNNRSRDNSAHKAKDTHGDGLPMMNGRNARSVWTIPTQGRPGNHYAAFPDRLAMLPILAGSKPGDLVLDPFGGSGTVGVVARQLRRRCVLIELNPDYALDAWGKLKLVSKFAGAVR